MEKRIVLRGGGDIASGIAYRLVRSGYKVILLEVSKPTMVRRTVSFAQAIYDKEMTIEGMTARLVESAEEALEVLEEKKVPILIDPKGESIKKLKPIAVVDAILAKKNLGTNRDLAPIVIGVGPGFTAGEDVHGVVETMRGHYLGKVILEGQAIPNTGSPGDIGGFTTERVLRPINAGEFKAIKKIGDIVKKGDVVAKVEDQPVQATIDGVLRGLLQDGIYVTPGFKIGDIDPRAEVNHCFTISDKARAVGGGVLEALLLLESRRGERDC